MNPQPLYLVCGVSGSGKTWVCEQLQTRFTYVPHDLFYDNHADVAAGACISGQRPVITECPFGERPLRVVLEKRGITVIPYFVIEDGNLIAQRYFKREGKPIQKAAYTRSFTIVNRAREWKAEHGRSHEILLVLQTESEKWREKWD